MPPSSITPGSYPYKIPPVVIDPNSEAAKNLNPWAVQEFFRIEALLRSKTVMELYKTEGRKPESDIKLMLKFRLNWNVLEGSHHHYLEAGSTFEATIPGIWVLTATELMWLAGALSSLAEDEAGPLKQQFFQWVQNGVLCLVIDRTLPTDVTLKDLRPILAQRHKGRKDVQEPRHFDLSTWLTYLSCYDLRFRDGFSYDEIGQRVYYLEKGETKRDQARKAVMKVRSLIEAVERNEWPLA